MNLSALSDSLGIPSNQINSVISLLQEDATVPFIARYRKEMTGSLDEVQIAGIKQAYDRQIKFLKRKQSILDIISEQGNLTPSLQKAITDCWDDHALEDLYLPYKKSRKTKADIAKEAGLEGLAKIISSQKNNTLNQAVRPFLNKNIHNMEDALQGARYIIASWMNENGNTRQVIRDMYKRFARIESSVIKKKSVDAQTYKDYFDYSEALNRIPSHRLLAVLRGEEEGLLKVKILIESERAIEKLSRYYIKSSGACSDQITLAIKDSLKRLIFPSIESEMRKEAKQKADIDAIDVFANNLKQLLLSAPLGEVPVLALDPGFRTGCKLVVLNSHGTLLHNSSIFPHPPQHKIQEAEAEIKGLLSKYNIKHIAIGDGTAGRESYQFLKALNIDLELYMVNENGASIYSASEIAREEFPHKDITVRGAVSIGRRLMDPLAELVKIDAKSIGVGQYQHDVNQSLLKEQLDQVVISCVNKIGINLNTASPYLLKYVSGLGPKLAQNIIQYRNDIGGFSERKELLKVPRMGKKAYEQAAGFLRINGGKNPLDNTGIHPERYKLVNLMLKNADLQLESLSSQTQQIQSIPLRNYVSDDIGIPTLTDIMTELQKPGVDPRGAAKTVSFSEQIKTIEDLSTGMILPGVVNNLTKFGAFVNIGIKDSALLHISEITDRFIKDPAEVLSLNQELKVKIKEVDVKRKRISVTLKF